MIVDEMHEEHPELLKDQYWDEVVPKDLPYTVASEHYRREEPKGSAEGYKVKESDLLYANMAPVHPLHRKTVVSEDMYADYVSIITVGINTGGIVTNAVLRSYEAGRLLPE